MIKDRTRQNIYIENQLMGTIQDCMEKDDTQSISEFTNRALKFYTGFLNTKRAENYLLSTFNASIRGTVDGAEQRLSGFMRSMLIELTMVRSLLATLMPNPLQEWQMRELYDKAAKQVDELYHYWDEE